MAEHFEIAAGGKAEKYALLLKQVEAVVDGEPDMIANMANVATRCKAQLITLNMPPTISKIVWTTFVKQVNK